MIRTILALLVAVLYLILTFPVLLILLFLGKKHSGRQEKIARHMIRWIFKVLLFVCGVRITLKGMDRVPMDTSVMYVGNHRSIFDILIIYANQPQNRTLSIVSKESIGKIPVFRYWAHFVRVLFFNRDDMKQALKMILESSDRLKNGTSILIFPEGTRNKQEEDLPLLPFHEGTFKMAKKSGCPIVPVALTNTINIFEKHFPKVCKTTVVAEFGTPVYIQDLSLEDQKRVGEYIQGRMTELIARNLK